MPDIANNYKGYKFNRVHKFAGIVSEGVDWDLEFGNWRYMYDEDEFIAAASKFNKKSLLHIYAYTYLVGYYNELFHKHGDIYEEGEIDQWIKIADNYGLQFKDVKCKEEVLFEQWYKRNTETFEKLFHYIADEVFFFLFQDLGFLLRFDELVSKIISNKEGQREWNIPENLLQEDKTLKRCHIPKWVKNAVANRDHCRCVFCGCDLTKRYTKGNNENYDHIIPLKRYGVNDPCNIQLTCDTCNRSKKDNMYNPQYQYESWW